MQVDQILAPTGKKKVAAEGPARFKKDLPTYIKNIKPTDPIIVIGCSSEPWNADQKSLKCVLAYICCSFTSCITSMDQCVSGELSIDICTYLYPIMQPGERDGSMQ